MKSKILLFTLLIIAFSCKKDTKKDSPPPKIYWGNAIYNPSNVILDKSTSQSAIGGLPIILGKDVIALQPKQTNEAPSKDSKEMTIGDTCYFTDIVKYAGLCYLNDITTKVSGTFLTTRKIQIVPVIWGNKMLVRGSAILNDDNSVDLEYTDSIKDGSFGVNHYKIHYTK